MIGPRAIVGSSIGHRLSQHAGQLLRPYDAKSRGSGAASEIGAHAATVPVQLARSSTPAITTMAASTMAMMLPTVRQAPSATP